MFFALYLIIFCMLLCLTKIKYRTIVKSNILFTGMWCICAGISSLGLYGHFKPTPIIHLYSITAIFVFNVVFILHNNKSKNSLDKTINIRGEARLGIIYFVNLIAWLYFSQFVPKTFNIISIYGLRELRQYAFDSAMGLATTKQLLIIQWVIYPIFVATVLIAINYLVIGRKKFLLNVFALIDVALYTLMFGGRYLIVKVMMYYIFAFLIVKSVNIEKMKNKKLSVMFIGTIIIAIIILTSQRNWGDTSFIENVVVYFTGSFTFLDVILSEFDWTNYPLFGMGVFGFIINLLYAPFALIFKLPYRGSNHIITQFTAIPRFISHTRKYNAMTTMLYPFIRDLGFIGIILGTSFLAWFISFAEKKFIKTNHLFYLCLYVYLAFVLFDSVMSYQLLFPASGVTIGFLFILIKTTK